MNDWDPDDLSKDEAYDLAADERRRKTVQVLLNERETWSVDALATEVAARENDIDDADVSEEMHRRVTVALLHQDLPKLADADVVRFDFEDETVEAGENIEDVDPLV